MFHGRLRRNVWCPGKLRTRAPNSVIFRQGVSDVPNPPLTEHEGRDPLILQCTLRTSCAPVPVAEPAWSAVAETHSPDLARSPRTLRTPCKRESTRRQPPVRQKVAAISTAAPGPYKNAKSGSFFPSRLQVAATLPPNDVCWVLLWRPGPACSPAGGPIRIDVCNAFPECRGKSRFGSSERRPVSRPRGRHPCKMRPGPDRVSRLRNRKE